jgi:hypothetical protein
MRNSLRLGFTVLEIVLALAISAVILLTVRSLAAEVTDVRNQLSFRVRDENERVNGIRIARRLVGNAIVTADSTSWFMGERDSAKFISSCDYPDGVSRRCEARFRTRALASSTELLVSTSASQTVRAASLSGDATLLFLDQENKIQQWRSSWPLGRRAPAAVAFATIQDTLTLVFRSR